MITITADITPANPKPRDRVYHTGRVQIGRAYIPKMRAQVSDDATLLQRALLDKRTAIEPSALHRIAGVVWGWL